MSEFSWTFEQGLSKKRDSDNAFDDFWLDLEHLLKTMTQELSSTHNRGVTVEPDGVYKARLNYHGRSLLVGADVALLRIECQVISSLHPVAAKISEVIPDYCQFIQAGPSKFPRSKCWRSGSVLSVSGFSLADESTWSVHSQLAEQMLAKLLFPLTAANDFSKSR